MLPTAAKLFCAGQWGRPESKGSGRRCGGRSSSPLSWSAAVCSPAVWLELFFRYRESVEAIAALQREMAQRQPSRFSSSCGTSRRPCERDAGQEIMPLA